MKNLIAFFIAVYFTTSGYATIRTICNDPLRPAQYTGIQAAQDAATAGDTLYIYGSSTNYGNLLVNKRLVIIGAGYNSNNQFGLSTVMNSIYLQRGSGLIDPSGTIISGLNVDGILLISGSGGVSNVKIFRNYVRNRIALCPYYNDNLGNFPSPGDVTFTANWIIYNNIINVIDGCNGTVGGAGPNNTLIQNNIFMTGIFSFRQATTLIDHNLFLNENKLGALSFVTISNNIFVRSNNNIWNDASLTFNAISNNLSNISLISPNAPTNSFLTGSNTGGGNLVGVDPSFENVPNLNTYNNTYDYRLKSASTVLTASTDGTELGIYGGSYPFPIGGIPGSGFATSANPAVPQVTSMVIQNASLPATNQLQVQVKAKVNN